MKHNLALVTATALCALALSACDKPAPNPKKEAAAVEDKTSPLIEKLKQDIKVQPLEGPRFRAHPDVVNLDVEQNGSVSSKIRIVNDGDEGTKIKGVIASLSQKGFEISGSCTTKPFVDKGEACDIDVTYADLTGRDTTATITVAPENDARTKGPIYVSLEFKVNRPQVVQEPTPAPAPAPEKKPVKTYSRQQADAIAAARAGGRVPTLGRVAPGGQVVASPPRPEIVMKNKDQRYDPENIPWTEASLPVDRARILTADRVIKAVLVTPVTNVMCNQVIAVVESHVYSPDNINVLIPRGTNAIGRCQAFADERVNIQWERMITPNGVNIRFINQLADSADAGGRAGVPGRIEQRFFDKYVLPLMSSLVDIVGAGARAMLGKQQTSTVDALSGTQTQTKSPMDVAIDQYDNRVSPQLRKYIDDITDVRKIVLIPGGTRLDIVPQEDIYFKSPYEVVRLADVEYDVRKPVKPPVIQAEMPPGYGLVPAMGKGDPRGTVIIDGRAYLVDDGAKAPADEGRALYAPPAMPNVPGSVRGASATNGTQNAQQGQGAPPAPVGAVGTGGSPQLGGFGNAPQRRQPTGGNGYGTNAGYGTQAPQGTGNMGYPAPGN
jgi:type IV secretory pathway VirB10-like protein